MHFRAKGDSAMQAIQNKLKSQKGASISFALLLFLVCAVISSVVIVAATAAGGRMSQLPEMDQRYYAVTSAANLLKSEIDGKRVVVEYSDSDSEPTMHVYKGDMEVNDTSFPDVLLRQASASLAREETPSWQGSDVELKSGFTVDGYDVALDCVIKRKLQNGLLEFEVKNKVSDPSLPNNQIYTLRIVFSSNTRESAVDSGTGTRKKTIEWKFHSMKK